MLRHNATGAIEQVLLWNPLAKRVLNALSEFSLTRRRIVLQVSSEPRIRQPRTPYEESEFWRNKGNEFFQFGDYARAKHCYTSANAALPSAASFANHALACMKLKEWQQAEEDCSHVCPGPPAPSRDDLAPCAPMSACTTVVAPLAKHCFLGQY
jgi:tetratricopeptide (TPR) repeat protein